MGQECWDSKSQSPIALPWKAGAAGERGDLTSFCAAALLVTPESGMSTVHLVLALGVLVQGEGCPMIYPLAHPQNSLGADGAAHSAGVGLSSPASRQL